MDLPFRRLAEVVSHTEAFDGIPIEFDPESGALGNLDATTGYLDILHERVFVDVDAGNRRPARLTQYGRQVDGEHGGESATDQLQPERLVGDIAQCAFAQHLRDPATNHEAVADPLSDRRHHRRITQVHGDWRSDLLAQGDVAGDIALGNRRFDDGQVGVLAFQAADQGGSQVGAQQHEVKIGIDLEVWRYHGADGLELAVEVVPGARLDLHRGEAL